MPTWMYLLFLLFPETPTSEENKLIVITAEEGESVNITCKFNHPEILGLSLKRSLAKVMNVLYAVEHGKSKTIAPEYENRMEYFELKNTATIMLKEVKKNDSDVYVCGGTVKINMEPKRMNFNSIILAVKASDMKPTKSSSCLLMLYAIVFMSLLLASGLGYLILSRIDVKKYCKKGQGKEAHHMVYEDMSYSLRRNTVNNLYEGQG
ncbi:uncharacterized protein LOC133382161 isoform X2 [Rhineura floridana]|uniref:uncharacterized protein LOC133382161 isoform X2 n=1 Tax=Rhineura floridana TaxID=261503 RepID=UPI002AC87641|nr:uncharacterized protein LOC133382161 isoform X2 [Rhineura floridana]